MNEEIEATIRKLVEDSGNPFLTGICCINIDHHAEDAKITTIFETVKRLREQLH